MAVTTAGENVAAFAWEATCERSTGFTKAEPIASRRLLPVFAGWPQRTSIGSTTASTESDLKAAKTALNEPGERQSYFEFRKELGL